ncbi:MAG: tetratricopeptide repeat protein [Candidatus Obscuribacterales bacterium]|nr:tetratricopeptide repeat protein [Candidatus Obscuribacterales bacterium]
MNTTTDNWSVLLGLASLVQKDDCGKAETIQRKALGIAEENYGEDSAEAGLCLIDLSINLDMQGRNTESDQLFEKAELILRRLAVHYGLVTD